MRDRSKIFTGKTRLNIEKAVISLINSEKDLMSSRTINSPRAVGDAIQELDDSNYFTLLMVAYKVEKEKIDIKTCHFVPIEHLDWNCLTIGALGWGQIQIANSNNIQINQKQTRKDWMLQLCDTLAEFYPKEIEKITGRIKHFKKIRNHWEKHPNY